MNETSFNNNAASMQDNQQMTLLDLWSMCIRRWPWFVLSVLVCLALGALYILKTPPVYTRSASVLIKEDAKGRSIGSDIQSSFSDLGLVTSNVNVNNEIINFASPDMMIEVVKRLHLETEYKLDHRFYDRTLYGSSLPLTVNFLDLGNSDYATLDVVPEEEGKYTLHRFKLNAGDLDKETTVSGAIGDTLETPLGRILMGAGSNPGVAPLSAPLHITRSGYYSAARRFAGALKVGLANKQATVIDLSMNDVNTQRAVETLSMLINVYNENWIKDKNQITTSTNEFISERLQVIESELGDVDNTITNFKSANRMPNIGASASMDMQVSMEANREIIELNNQLSIARYLLSFIRDSQGKLLPADAGLKESSIQNLINQFNTTLLQRNRLVESSSEENYLVQDLDRQLESMRGAILTSIDNYIVSVNMRLASSRATQATADARISNNPQQA
ncbi:MAG: chromosome partitioning protein ParA, partial [Bacteroidales bacterium]|nr:chromosome partitioning protein ParA [Bacteroidales bacterium]